MTIFGLMGLMPSWLSSMLFWVFGFLALTAAFSFGLFGQLEHGNGILGVDFVFEQVALAALLFGAVWAAARFFVGLIFAFEWLPLTGSSGHRRIRNAMLAIVFSLMFIGMSQWFIELEFWYNRLMLASTAAILLVPVVFGGIASLRKRSVRGVFASQGSLIMLTSLLIWFSVVAGWGRATYLTESNYASICLFDGAKIDGSVVHVGEKYLTLVFDERWYSIPSERVLYIRDYDLDETCSLPTLPPQLD
ncbi:hypothetical protein SLH47_25025 [Cognatiyoonia sp. IB215182]|nr:hypothetical protein [Cognatiyoonia sp. IB215182]